jgi:RNase P subunit RPR2
MKKYWCVMCDNCHPLIAIPLLEYDSTRQKQNPQIFRVTCLHCESTSMFDETELEVRKMERVPAFQPAEGFRNI